MAFFSFVVLARRLAAGVAGSGPAAPASCPLWPDPSTPPSAQRLFASLRSLWLRALAVRDAARAAEPRNTSAVATISLVGKCGARFVRLL
jgi:hypothetical protein